MLPRFKPRLARPIRISGVSTIFLTPKRPWVTFPAWEISFFGGFPPMVSPCHVKDPIAHRARKSKTTRGSQTTGFQVRKKREPLLNNKEKNTPPQKKREKKKGQTDLHLGLGWSFKGSCSVRSFCCMWQLRPSASLRARRF